MPTTKTYQEDRYPLFGYFSSELRERLLARAKRKKQSMSATLNEIAEIVLAQEEAEQRQRDQALSVK